MDRDLEQFRQDAARKQIQRAAPKKIGESVGKVLVRTGAARVMSSSQLSKLWGEAVGEKFASQTRIGSVNRGILEVIVKNSAMLQELTFSKQAIIKRLTATAAEHKIRDLRFKVGMVE